MKKKIVYIQGILISKIDHRKMISAFERSEFNFNFLSLPGHDDEPAITYNENFISAYYSRHKDLIDSADILCGHSTGAKMIVQLVDEFPKLRVKEIVLIDPAIRNGTKNHFNYPFGVIKDFIMHLYTYVNIPFGSVVHSISNFSNAGETIKYVQNEDIEKQIKVLKDTNHKILWGTIDQTTPYSWTERIKTSYPELNIIPIQGRPHGWALEEPEILIGELRGNIMISPSH